MMRKVTALKKLAKVMNDVTSGAYGMPIIKTPQDDGWDMETLCWDGPFEWIMITSGSSIFAGETGLYSTPTETKIQKVLELIYNDGYRFEPVNNCQICIFKD